MKVNEDLSILFWLKREKATKEGLVPIYVRVTVKGDRDNFSSGKKIHPDFWDEETGTALSGCPDGKMINSYITKTKAELERHYNQLAGVNKKIKAAMIKEAYMPKQILQKTLMQAFKLHNEEFAERVNKNKGSKGTLARYERLKDKAKDFLKKKLKLGDIALEDIEMAFAVNFFHYLTMENVGDNTAMKYVKTLKQIIDRAIDEGWIKHNTISGFKCTYKDPDRETLEMHELVGMYEKEISVERLAEVRDVYVFCCFTGYAYETVYNLEPANIFKGLDGKLWITKDRQKTGVEETVPLLPIDNPYNNLSNDDACGIYINYLGMAGLIIVPTFGMKEDEEAVQIIRQLFPNYKILTLNSSEIAKKGGILNCISWNIKVV